MGVFREDGLPIRHLFGEICGNTFAVVRCSWTSLGRRRWPARGDLGAGGAIERRCCKLVAVIERVPISHLGWIVKT